MYYAEFETDRYIKKRTVAVQCHFKPPLLMGGGEITHSPEPVEGK